MNEFWLILGMMLVTFGVRYPVLALVGRIPLPQRLFRSLRYVPVAVLTAISVPELLLRDGELAIRWDNPYLIAGIVAIIIAWRTKNLLWTIVIGMTLFLIWRAVFGG